MKKNNDVLIKKVGLQNFKVFGTRKHDFEIRPLTLFVGPNGTGKTTILQAIGLMAQSIASRDRIAFVLKGDLVDFPKDRLGSLFHKGNDKNWMMLEIGFNGHSIPGLPSLVKELYTKTGSSIKLPDRFTVGYKIAHRVSKYDDWRHEFLIDNNAIVATEVTYPEKSRSKQRFHVIGINDKDISHFDHSDSNVLFGRFFNFRLHGGSEKKYDTAYLGQILKNIIDLYGNEFQRIWSLTPLRGTELMARDIKDVGGGIGKHGENTLRYLLSLQTQEKAHVERMNRYLKLFGIRELMTGHAGQLLIGLNYKDPINDAVLSIDYAASGSKNAVIIIAALARSEPGQVFLIEEPEISMHPAYEKALAEVFVEEIRRGQQIIISTHSEVLTWAVCNLVRKKKISREDVAIWELKRNKKGVQASMLEISEKGNLEKGWVSSFSKVERDLLDEWGSKVGPANVLPRKMNKKKKK